MATFLTSRQFNQDTSGAKRAAADGPVYIADRGRQAHVLLTIEEYEKLLDGKTSLLGLFMGEVMKLSKGKADPKMATELVKEMLEK